MNRETVNALAILTRKVIENSPDCADSLIQEVLIYIEENLGHLPKRLWFKRDMFMKAVVERVDANGTLPKDSEYINEYLESCNVIPFQPNKPGGINGKVA